MTPIISLKALSLVHPIVGTGAISVDAGALPLVVDTDQSVIRVEVLIDSQVVAATEWTLVNGKRRFQLAPEVAVSATPVRILMTGRNYDPSLPEVPGFVYRATPTLTLSYIYVQSATVPAIDPPSGVKVYRGANSCKLEWVKPEHLTGLLGVRVQISTDPTGVNVPYRQLGTYLISKITRTANNVVNSATTTKIDPIDNATVILTTTQNTEPTNFSSVDVSRTNVGGADKFYAVLSSVIQDAESNHVYESNFNGPFTCGFVDLKQITPADFLVAQQKEEIALRLISSTIQNYPDLDLTPRSELRDVLIDPVALELSEQSVREWFTRVSTSISAMATLDDYDGDGFSDAVDSNPYKPIIARSWGLSNTNTQALIDRQFDILGERAGLTRGGATASVVPVTIYSYNKPTTRMTVDADTSQISSVSDADTPALTFNCRGSAIIDPATADALYDSTGGRWAITLPFECATVGSIGNVGVGSIRQPMRGIPPGWLCSNESPADFGTDGEINIKYAERIKDRLVVGVDSGRRLGYLNTARSTPGVIEANVVASGDLEMLRDWDDLRKKHTAGTVDVFVRGSSTTQTITKLPFAYSSPFTFGVASSYAKLDYVSKAFDGSNIGKKAPKMEFKVRDISVFNGPISAVVDLMAVSNTAVIHLGTSKVKVNATSGVLNLDPNELTYQIIDAGMVSEHTDSFKINGLATNNQTFMASLGSSAVTYYAALRIATPLSLTPSLQPVSRVFSIAGEDAHTGIIPASLHRLIRTDDPLLNGFSNRASDIVQVDSATLISPPPVKTVSFATVDLAVGNLTFTARKISRSVGSWLADGVDIGSTIVTSGFDLLPTTTYTVASVTALDLTTLEAITPNPSATGVVKLIPVVPIDSAMPLTATGNILSVRNLVGGLSTVVYAYETDYSIVPLNRYGSYGIRRLSTSSIPLDTDFVVSYNKYNVFERCEFVTESLTLSGSTPTPLGRAGFIKNVWVPESYGITTLSMDGYSSDPTLYTAGSLCSAQIKKPERYLKVVFNGIVMLPVQDYTLTLDPVSNAGSLTRVSTGRIPANASVVTVSYFVHETFNMTVGSPAFIAQVASAIESSRHAAGDVLVKNMMGNPVDVDLTVELASNTDAATMDNRIRTSIGVVLDNAKGKLTQSEVIRQVKNLNGVANVVVPLTKFAKSNGSYNVGAVIPTGTPWTKVSEDPLFSGRNMDFPLRSFITEEVVLTDTTLPSGGEKDSFVGLLYEGEAYTRALSLDAFRQGETGSFYITGAGDFFLDGNTEVSLPSGRILLSLKDDVGLTTLPSYLFFRVTYQIWEEGGTKDISLSPTEYLKSGRVTISYIPSN